MKKIFVFVALLAGCSALPIVESPSANHDSRINYLVLHFTSEDFAESLRLLAEPVERRVSVHYLVPEPDDETYHRSSLAVHRLVAEARRARHAGVSHWGGRQNLNDSSIGIEIVNRSGCVNDNPDTDEPTPEDQSCNFLPYPEAQLDLVIRLAADILERNPDIDPVDVIGHGDIATSRRVDPGPLFPWQRLYENGIGAWYEDAAVARYRARFERQPADLALVQRALGAYGYLIDETGENDVQSRFVTRAFQMHFRPGTVSGEIDAETAAILFALLERYRPDALEPGGRVFQNQQAESAAN